MQNKIQKINGDFKGKSFVSIDQLTSYKDIELIFDTAKQMERIVQGKRRVNMLFGYTIGIIFYQPSTRTFTSFLAAAKWLRAITISIHEMNSYSSSVKGESLADTVRSLYQTSAVDLIILRHPEDSSSEVAANASYVPILNAGSGKKEHPTQAVLDLYTIKQRIGRVDNLKIAMVGDLKNGRTIKSLAKILKICGNNNTLYFVSPEELKAPDDFVKEIGAGKTKVIETDDLKKVLPEVDAVYMTRVQKEWFTNAREYDRVKNFYILDKNMMKLAKKDMLVMHPLPRVDEISYEVDQDPRAAYFEQMRSGLYTRMALLKLILEGK